MSQSLSKASGRQAKRQAHGQGAPHTMVQLNRLPTALTLNSKQGRAARSRRQTRDCQELEELLTLDRKSPGSQGTGSLRKLWSFPCTRKAEQAVCSHPMPSLSRNHPPPSWSTFFKSNIRGQACFPKLISMIFSERDSHYSLTQP